MILEMDQAHNFEFVSRLVMKYLTRHTVTNNYFLVDSYSKYIDEGRLYSITTESNACLFVKMGDYYKLYYYINNENELISLDNKCPYVMEILYRGESYKPHRIIEYWQKCGFREHLTRDLMMASRDKLILPNVTLSNITIKYADNDQESLFAENLIESTFDKYTGDILSMAEIEMYIKKGNILCAYIDGVLSGILQFEIKNGIVWIGHLAVAEEFRGIGIANSLISRYIFDNAAKSDTKYQLWVVQGNKNARTMYEKFGFAFGNKSSLSMLLS